MNVTEFAAWWLVKPIIRPPADIYAVVSGNVGVTLYREDQFQVQMWACPPGAEIADHAHPGVRGYAVRVGGKIWFRRDGKPVTRADTIPTIFAGKYTMMHLIEPGVTHGASVGAEGACFLAITEWLDGKPRSVHLAWEGEPLDARHASELRG